MRATLTLARYQLLMLLRNPTYWLSALLIAALGILAFGLFFSDPTGPRLGVVDEAHNEASERFIQSTDEIEGVNVRVGDREEMLTKLEDGERWAVVVLPEDFGDDPALAGVEVWSGAAVELPGVTGSGILRQLLVEAVDATEANGIEVAEMPVEGDRSLRLIDVVLPGQIGLSLMFGNLFAATTLAFWRHFGMLRRISAAPVSPRQLLVSQLAVFGLLSTFQAALLLTAGRLLFDVPIRGNPAVLAVTVLAGVFALLTLWYTIAAFVRSPVAVNAVATLIAFMMMMAGGSYVPLNDPPLILEPFVLIAPLTYLNDALRAVVNDGEGLADISLELGVLGAWIAGLFVLSTRIFRWSSTE